MVVTACPLDCPDTCSLEVTVEAGRLTKIGAAAGNPLTQGFICQKVKHHGERVYGADRVLTPLVRSGPKGSDQYRSASWDEALDLVARRLAEVMASDGPAAVVPFLYGSSAGVLARGGLSSRLWRRLGASEVLHTICAATAGAAWDETFGSMLSADPFDVVNARLVVVWGANPTVSNTHLPPLIRQAQDAGARLVVVDPRRTAMAARADVHLAVRPGTDVVLALAAARHLFSSGGVDERFLAEHAAGVEEYRAAAEPWTLRAASEVCGVEADTIAAFAEEYASTRPAFLRLGWGLERNRNGGSACKAVLALPVLCGQFAQEGGGVLASLSAAAPVSMRAGDASLGGDASPPRRLLNMNEFGPFLCGQVSGPPARLLFVQGANPAVMCPDQTAVVRGLARDDLFTVVHDQVMTDTARYADVVLPAPTHFETDDLATSYGSFTLQRMRPVIERVGQACTDDEVAAGLAERLGLAGFVVDPPAQMATAVLDGDADGARVLRAAGTTIQFRDTWPTTPQRRARLFNPGSEVEVPSYRELASPYPLTLLSPATHRTINSIFGERDGPEPRLGLHPDDAARRGIAEGDRVRVWNELGSLEVSCHLDGDLQPGVCTFPKGIWRRTVGGGFTANALVGSEVSDLAGGACFNDARVDVASVHVRPDAP